MFARLPAAALASWLTLTAFSTVEQPRPSPRATGPVAVGPGGRGAEPKPFRHDQHVADAWVRTNTVEVWRDCRGCHRFDAQNPFSSPQDECDKCHILQGTLQPAFEPGWQKDLARYATRTHDAFRHHTHAMLDCRQCHATPRLFPHFDIRTGPGQCAPCHEQGRLDFASLQFFDEAAAEAARKMGEAAYAQKLVEAFAGKTGGINTTPLPTGGDFDHGDHCGVQNGVLGTLLACVECHGNIPKATTTEVGTGRIPADKCGLCHVKDEKKAPAQRAEGQKQLPRPLWSLGTFAHGEHFAFQNGARKKDVCSEAAYRAIEQGCGSCHTYEPEAPGRPGRDFPFAKGKSRHRYDDCVACHDLDPWQTGETKTAPLHGSSDGRGWSRCAACHVFGEPDVAGRRPMAKVERRAARTFVFRANVHPDITSRGDELGKPDGRTPLTDCKDCHRNKVTELPTRLARKRFRHDSHLGATPEPKDCLACHPSASTAATSAQLGGAGLRTYSLAGCTQCHRGGEVTELEEPAEPAASRELVEFSHAQHVTAGKQSCFECHALGDGRGIDTKKQALACNQCHDHKRNGPEDRGLAKSGAASCARCHHQPATPGAPLVASVPPVRSSPAAATDARYGVVQTVFAGYADAQFHPLGMQCTECHKARVTADAQQQPKLVAIDFAGTDHLRAIQSGTVHSQAGAKEPAACLRCHWKPVGKWEDAVRGAAGTPAEKMLRRLPDGPATRKEFGNSSDGYPGGERARG
ncbi:MAG TPA: cytochrome c3 family protein [Planctomycetota bacterium]|nr:cytochrome c3 family protein [Planctomycetota bacterium]